MEFERGNLVSPISEVPVVEGEIVTAIRELADRGWGSKAIARELGVARNTVRRYRRHPVVAGQSGLKGWRFEVMHALDPRHTGDPQS
jgi:FixJ family two-component response regulator